MKLSVDGAVVRAIREVSNHQSTKGFVAGPGTKRTVENPRSLARFAEPRVDSMRVVVGPFVRLDAPSDPLRCGTQAVEIYVATDRVDRPGGCDSFGCDHLGASAVLSLRSQDETRIAGVVQVALVVMVVDPHRQPRAKPLNERKCGFLVAGPTSIRGKGDIEHHHTPWETVGLGQLTGRSVRQMRETTHIPSMWPGLISRNWPMPGSVFPKPMPRRNKPEIHASHRSPVPLPRVRCGHD